ncbi:MAG: hypothetical protein LBG48_04120 [Rickettsiales bacterium]|nr:hypothetical protein [Rickettsiales bacterium]
MLHYCRVSLLLHLSVIAVERSLRFDCATLVSPKRTNTAMTGEENQQFIFHNNGA